MRPEVREAVDRLAEALKKAPIIRPAGTDRFRLFVADLETGESAAIVDEPEKGRERCGSPCWSPDGRKILFHAAPLDLWQLSRIESLEPLGEDVVLTDLGAGRFPNFSPDGARVAYSLIPRADRNDAPGIWTMKADGRGRRWLGAQGKPIWSPDGRRVMVVDSGGARPPWMMDSSGQEYHPIELEGWRLFSTPAWHSPDTLIASIGRESADSIAVINVADPERATLKEVLWRRSAGPDVEPGEIAISRETGRCLFVGAAPAGKAVYSFKLDNASPPRRVERDGFDDVLGDLAVSPGGRYLLFQSNNSRRPRGRPLKQDLPKEQDHTPAAEVARLVAALASVPAIRPEGSDRFRVLLMELSSGKTWTVLDEPDRRLSFCGSISWSHDGRRIFLDANPPQLYQMSHIKSVELVDGRPALIEHKPGNCPSLSPDGRWIAYLANSGGDSIERPGAWVMRADGSEPRYLDVYGGPNWSPNGRKLTIADFGSPPGISIFDVDSGSIRRVRLGGRRLDSAPEWAGEDILLAIMSTASSKSIGLLDVSQPEEASVKEVVWERPVESGLTPSDVVHDPRTGLFVAAIAGTDGMRLYRFERGKPASFRRLDSEGPDPMIADLSLSPDGRYLLFRSNNPEREPR